MEIFGGNFVSFVFISVSSHPLLRLLLRRKHYKNYLGDCSEDDTLLCFECVGSGPGIIRLPVDHVRLSEPPSDIFCAGGHHPFIRFDLYILARNVRWKSAGLAQSRKFY